MKAGFIGLGAMGWHMAGHLAQAKLLGGLWNRSTDKARALGDELAVPVVDSPAALWALADAVVLCVRADEEVLQMVKALAVPEAQGRLVIDTSTVSVETAREAATLLAEVGARFLDAPITGGTEGARLARITFMVGGEAADVEAATPLFAAMGARHVHLGAVGAGQACKAVNQVMAAGINQAVTEGIAFAEALGLNIDQVVEVVGSGAAGSWFVNHRGRNMVAGDYPPGFKVGLHLKDLRICQRMAKSMDGRLPTVDLTVIDYERLIESGHGDEDISALYRRRRDLFPKR
jgi:3-hydroxyisobutyrate dehydrogenase